MQHVSLLQIETGCHRIPCFCTSTSLPPHVHKVRICLLAKSLGRFREYINHGDPFCEF